MPAPAAGVLDRSIAVKDGETVAVGALLGAIERRRRRGAGRQARPEDRDGRRPSDAGAGTAEAAAAAAKPRRRQSPRRRHAAGAVGRKIAAETELDPAAVAGTGKDGRVTKGDVLAAHRTRRGAADAGVRPAAAVQARAPSPPDDAAREERVRMTRLRQTIARRLKDAQNTAAMLTTFNEVDMSAVMALRAQYKDLFEKKHGVKLGFMGFFVKACVQALKEIPAVNAEIDGNDIVYKNYYDIGVAVGTERGLVVPVVRDADQMSLAEIEKIDRRFRHAARATASSRSRSCRAAPSPSPMAASTAR